jgi:hypothetical protein
MNAEDVLKYGHTFVLGAMQPFPAAEWQTPDVCGFWSTKDIIAHLASFEQMLIDVLHTFIDDRPTLCLDEYLKVGGQRFNEIEVGNRKDRTPQAVWDEYRAGQSETMRLINQIPVSKRREPGTLRWYGPEYDLEDYIAYTFYGHKREHMAQVNVFLDTLKRR